MRSSTKLRWAINLSVLIFVGLTFSSIARADSVGPVSINNPNPGLSGTPGPYATVNLLLVTVNQGLTVCTVANPCVNVTVTMQSNFEMFGGNGAGDNNGAFGFNYTGITGLTITNLSDGFSYGGTGGNMDGFGTFGAVIDDGNASHAHTGLTFTVSGVGLTQAAQLFVANGNNAHFAIHVAPTNGNPTGFAADQGAINTPEPTTMMLLGSGLVGIAASLRRRYRKS